MTGSGREAILDVREWSGGPPGGPEEVGRPSRMFGCGWEAFPVVQEWLGGPPGCPGSGQDALPDVRE